MPATPKVSPEVFLTAEIVNQNKSLIPGLTDDNISPLLNLLFSHDIEVSLKIAEALKGCEEKTVLNEFFENVISTINNDRQSFENKIKIWYLLGLSYFLPSLYRVLLNKGFLQVVGQTVVEVYLASIHARDQYTHEHCERVAEYAAILATAGQKTLGLPDEDISKIKEGASIHDLGKLTWPDNILTSNKKFLPGSDERAEIDKHSKKGVEIFQIVSKKTGFPLDNIVKKIILFHHEKWDGSGPHSYSRNKIPVYAQIVSVVDVFDALTYERPYRVNKIFTFDEAINEIAVNMGKNKFKQEIINVFTDKNTGNKIRKAYDEMMKRYKC